MFDKLVHASLHNRLLVMALSIVLMVVVTIAYLACARWLKMERT